jgi:nucleoside-diphosphate-sugar epimerase
MTTLVTGATGFIGGHLCAHLVALGEEVRVLARDPSRLAEELRNRVEVVTGDLTAPESLSKAVDGAVKILHLGGTTHALHPSTYFKINARGTRNLIKAVRKAGSGLKRFVFISSIAAAGPSPEGIPLDESCRPSPCTPYGSSKLEAEIMLRNATDFFPVTVLRPPIVYGQGDRATLEFFKFAALGLLPRARPDRMYSVIHSLDLARAIYLASEVPSDESGTYFVSHPKAVSWNSMMRTIHRAVNPGREIKVTVSNGMLRLAAEIGEIAQGWFGMNLRINRSRLGEFMPRAWLCSPEKARIDFGFRAEIDLAEGVRQALDWYREKGWL